MSAPESRPGTTVLAFMHGKLHNEPDAFADLRALLGERDALLARVEHLDAQTKYLHSERITALARCEAAERIVAVARALDGELPVHLDTVSFRGLVGDDAAEAAIALRATLSEAQP